jgi:polysaccharide biosynthesis transport protein
MSSSALPTVPTTAGHMPGSPHAAPFSRFAPIDPMRVLRRHALLLCVATVASALIGTVLWLLLNMYWPIYTTESQLAIAGTVGPYDVPQTAGDVSQTQLEQIAAFIKNQSIRITSDQVLSELLNHPDVRSTDWFKGFGPNDTTRTVRAKDQLQKYDLDASQIRGSTLMRVTIQSHSTQDLQKILDILVGVYRTRLARDSENQSLSLRRTFLEEQTRAERDLENIDKQLDDFMRTHDLTSLRETFNETQITYQLLADQHAKLALAAGATSESYKVLEASMGDASVAAYTPENNYVVEHDQAVFQMTEEIRNLEVQVAVDRVRLGPRHPVVEQRQHMIDEIDSRLKVEKDRLLRNQAQVNLERARKDKEGLMTQLASIQPQLTAARERMKELSITIQDFERKSESRKGLIEQKTKAGDLINQIRMKDTRDDSVRVHLQQPAIQPELTFPKSYIIIPGVAVLVLGSFLALIFLNELLDQRVKGPEEVKMIPNADLLGVVPEVGEDPSTPARIDNIVRVEPAGLLAEGFRQARTAILARMDRRGYKTLLVSCAQPQSGVSSVVNNLALSLALNGRKVLVLDANLRRPDQHRLFETPAKPGMVEVLRGQAALEDAIVRKEDPTVDILPTGDAKDAPPELLESAQFRSMLTQLEARYDIILIDAPPVLLASDCQILAKQADAIVLVVRALADTRGMVGRMLRTLNGFRAEVIGVVLNGARSSAGGYFRENYQQFHAYRRSRTPRGDSSGRRARTVDAAKD